MEPIKRFAGEYLWLSNFYVESDGTCVEREFQAAKANDPVERGWVEASKTPSEAKRRGRIVVLRPDWDEVRLHVMRDLLICKFSDHPELAEKLRATQGRELIEGNTWGDRFWGVCYGQGENHLGKLLMEIRDA